MDDYHERMGEIGGYILASDDPIRGSRNFQSNGKVYKGYRIVRNNSIIDLTAPRESEYINAELSTTLTGKFENSISEDILDSLRRDYENDINQRMSNQEVVDMHYRRMLPDLEDESVTADVKEIESVIDNPNVRLDWITYSDTSLLNGFIIYTRLFPDSLSLESYDSAVNQISYFGPLVDEKFTEKFGEFVEEIQDEGDEIPTGGSQEEEEPEGLGRGFA